MFWKNKKIIIEISIYIILILFCIFIVPRFFVNRVSVEGSSMEPTLSDKDQLIGERISTRKDTLKRYDIIYFYPDILNKDKTYIKRIIGLPGESIRIENSTIYINGNPISDHFCNDDYFEAGIAESTICLADDEYFVMGDNRNNSVDSRSLQLKVIKKENIQGRAIFRFWPLSNFGTLK